MSQVTVDQALQMAVGHHQAGRFKEAQEIYRQIVEACPEHADALHLLGATHGQLGDPATAVKFIQQAISVLPGQYFFYSNLGKFLLDAGDVEHAIKACRKAIGLRGDFAESHSNLGNALKANGELEPAIAAFREAIRLNPNYGEAYSNLGNALRAAARYGEAEAACRRAIELRPNFAEAHNNLGHVLEGKGDHLGAVAACQDAVNLKPTLAQAHNNLAIALFGLERYQEAENSARHALFLKPDFAEAYNTLGTILNGQSKYDEAIECCQRALSLKPDFAEAHNNIGSAMVSSGKVTEGIAEYRAALAIDGDHEQAVSNLSGALNTVGEYKEALAVGEEAISKRPELGEPHFNMGIMLLQRGDLKRGFEEYEWRFRNRDAVVRPFKKPRWTGEALHGKRILIHAEQGFGDTLQFIRYAKLVKAMGGTVIAEVQKELRALMETVAGIDELVVQGDELPPFDVQIPLMSVPMAVGTTLETVPAEIPYVKADPAIVGAWRDRLAGIAGKKVGIVWAGSKHHKGDKVRSMMLADLAPVAAVPGVKLLSLQKGEPSTQVKGAPFEVIDWTQELNSFSDTAGLIENLDLVISVDTSVCHLAGALGRKVWVMIPTAGEWRWLIAREDSPWYPTLRLFRQTTAKDWLGVTTRVAEALQA